MKFLEILRFELVYQFKSLWTWVIMILLITLSFMMARDGSLAEVLYEDFFINAPFAIAKTTVFGNLIWLMVSAIVAGEAAARDVSFRMHPLMYTTRISKLDYLGGRFLGALFVNAVVLISIQFGILLGVYLPGVQAEAIAPFHVYPYLTAYAYIALPTALAATAIQFSFATWTGRPMASYLGSFFLVFMGFFVASLLFFKRGFGTLLDPIGIRFIVEDLSYLWTPTEKNYRLIELTDTVLTNRMIWIGASFFFLILLYLTFEFRHRVAKTFKLKLWRFKTYSRAVSHDDPSARTIVLDKNQELEIGNYQPNFGFGFHVRQTLSITLTSFRAILWSRAGLAVILGIPLLMVPVILDQMESNGVPMSPATMLVIKEMTASLSDELSRWVIIPVIIVFFAGELVWRERDARIAEISDTMPVSEWAPLLGKFFGLSLVLMTFMAGLTVAGVLAQTLRGYDDYQIALYLKIMFGLQLPEYLLFAFLAMAIHVIINQKYVAHIVAIILYGMIALSSLFGLEHNLLVFTAGPAWTYTEMRGFGSSLEPWLWFKLYWAAWTLLLAAGVKLLWVRGREKGIAERLKIARARYNGVTNSIVILAVLLIVLLGAFIFYNTNILNAYQTASEAKGRAAAYEKRYGRYADSAQPVITKASLDITIYPQRGVAEIQGVYHLINNSKAAIDYVLIATKPGLETGPLVFDRKSKLVSDDEALYQRIYSLSEPLQPGDSLKFNFELAVKPHGFRENGIDPLVIPNGTSLTDGLFPSIGYVASRELVSASDRREHGLPKRALIPSLYDVAARSKKGQGIILETTLSTDDGQVAVAPGLLVREWKENGRSYFHYKTDGTIGSEWAFFSANYTVHRENWSASDSSKAVTIQIFHHPEHKAHLERMIKSVRASLTYYSKEFGAYESSHLTLAERPGLATGMHADATMITHPEGFTFWDPGADSGSHDHPYAIVAHEMAHQWTVPFAPVEGAPVMSESVAWYYAMKAIEHSKGNAQLRGLLNYMRQPYPYPAIRRGDPLLKGLDPYLSYRRGPFALYAISEYIGEGNAHNALRAMLERHSAPTEPLATTLDLYDELQRVTPDSLRYLLHDLFEVNTYWKLETEKATVVKIDQQHWEVTLEIEAHKIVTDSAGVDAEVVMQDYIELGVFGGAMHQREQSRLYLQKHWIHSGKQSIVLHVSDEPTSAGVDPNHLLIDLEPENNEVEIEVGSKQ